MELNGRLAGTLGEADAARDIDPDAPVLEGPSNH